MELVIANSLVKRIQVNRGDWAGLHDVLPVSSLECEGRSDWVGRFGVADLWVVG